MIVLFLDVTNPKTFKPVVTGLHLVQTFVTMFPNNVTMYQSISKKTGIEDLPNKVKFYLLPLTLFLSQQ